MTVSRRMHAAFTICVTCKEKFDGERGPCVDHNRKPGARTAGHSARRKDRVGATLPKLERRVLKQASFSLTRINRLAYDHDIRGADGKLFTSRYISSVTVGNPYGQSRSSSPHHPALSRSQGPRDDEPIRPYSRRNHEGKTVGVSERYADRCLGKVVAEEGLNDTSDLRWFTRSVLAQALTNGYCAIPIVAGPCPHPNACLNCAHFRTDVTFLEVHRAELHETERVIAKADANGWVRQSEMNERKRTSLINIVATLEANHG